MPPLPVELRRQLEKTVIEARDVAERAAFSALDVLAMRDERLVAGLSQPQRDHRNALRARARALGEGSYDRGLLPLAEEVAYEQWHRMLFARFLAENDLLIHPTMGVAVTLAECAELAGAEGEPDEWMVAARYAAAMLPGIFKQDDPSARVRFAPNDRQALEQLLNALPAILFRSDDALGWVYQFWQTKAKKEVNASGRKVGGKDLAPVTQLFTEDYMVRFLLENSLGAWWAARHPESPLLAEWHYLRFLPHPPAPSPAAAGEGEEEPDAAVQPINAVLPSPVRDGRGAGGEGRVPAAGTFPGWPETAAEVTVMDPCCGSGHFLVAAADMLRKVRMEEEGLGEGEAAAAVLRDNLFGLELDPRCTQIAAFALAFDAWKHGMPVPTARARSAVRGTESESSSPPLPPRLFRAGRWVTGVRGDR